MKQPCVYILSNKFNGTLYIGVTSDLLKRTWQHKQKIVEGFSATHDLNRLIYFEFHDAMLDAINREKQLKKWKRQWKIHLIQQLNPYWRDLYFELL